MANSSRYLCGVPKDECCGAACMGNNSLGKTIKAHGSSEQAFKCYEQYLLRNGYKKIGSREFQPIAGGPVMVLTKKSHFGGRLRKGKSGEKAVSSGNRFVPISKGKHNPAGIIV